MGGFAPMPDEDRYTVDRETGCWVGCRDLCPRDGYARMTVGGKRRAAYRVFYERYVGPIPEGYDLDHVCRNRACLNPAHLEPVTRAENLRRGARTKLDWSRVHAIRLMYATTNISTREIAELFGVSPISVKGIVRFRTWKVPQEVANANAV